MLPPHRAHILAEGSRLRLARPGHIRRLQLWHGHCSNIEHGDQDHHFPGSGGAGRALVRELPPEDYGASRTVPDMRPCVRIFDHRRPGRLVSGDIGRLRPRVDFGHYQRLAGGRRQAGNPDP